MITVEDWALIRRLHLAEGESMRSIAARLGISRNTVAKAVSADGPPTYERAPQDSGIKAVEPTIRALLRENPRMPATVLAERVGWSGSPSWFRENVARIRPEYAPADPADRISYEPGDQAQCDLWFPRGADPGRARQGADAAGAGDGGLAFAVHHRPDDPVPDDRGPAGRDVGCCSGSLGAVPRRLIWDNETGIGRRDSYAAGVAAFAGVLATRIVQLKPYDPECKGIVERANQLPGDLVPARPDLRLTGGLQRSTRPVAADGQRPAGPEHRCPPGRADRRGPGRDAARCRRSARDVGFAARVRLPRDYYVRVRVQRLLRGSAGDRPARRRPRGPGDRHGQLATDGRVGTHQRSWGARPDRHRSRPRRGARTLREAFQNAVAAPEIDGAGLRDLADYDRAFGVDFETGRSS